MESDLTNTKEYQADLQYSVGKRDNLSPHCDCFDKIIEQRIKKIFHYDYLEKYVRTYFLP